MLNNKYNIFSLAVTPTVLADIDGVYLIRVDSAETGRYQLNLIATKYRYLRK